MSIVDDPGFRRFFRVYDHSPAYSLSKAAGRCENFIKMMDKVNLPKLVKAHALGAGGTKSQPCDLAPSVVLGGLEACPVAGLGGLKAFTNLNDVILRFSSSFHFGT